MVSSTLFWCVCEWRHRTSHNVVIYDVWLQISQFTHTNSQSTYVRLHCIRTSEHTFTTATIACFTRTHRYLVIPLVVISLVSHLVLSHHEWNHWELERCEVNEREGKNLISFSACMCECDIWACVRLVSCSGVNMYVVCVCVYKIYCHCHRILNLCYILFSFTLLVFCSIEKIVRTKNYNCYWPTVEKSYFRPKRICEYSKIIWSRRRKKEGIKKRRKIKPIQKTSMWNVFDLRT